MCIDIYMYLHMHMHISTHKLIKTINILLFTASCFTNTVSLPKDLFVHLCILCLFCSGMFFSFCFGVDIVLVLAWLLVLFFFLGRRRTNTFKTIFLLVIKFIKIHGIQLLLLRVTLSLDGCEILDWVKLATVEVWIHLPGKIPIWTIPYCISTQKPIAVSGNFSWALICWASNQTWKTASFFYSSSSVLSHC